LSASRGVRAELQRWAFDLRVRVLAREQLDRGDHQNEEKTTTSIHVRLADRSLI
jgi:hypothetical protein